MTASVKRKTAKPKNKSKVLLVDDHPIIRQGLSQMINHEPDLAVCGEAESVREALEVIASTGPDIVIVDISLKGSSGIDLIKDIKVRHPKLPALVLSMHDESLYAERVLRAGARGYIMKQDPSDKVLAGIRRVIAGHIYVSEAVSERLLTTLADGKTVANRTIVENLTDRELEVFRLIGQGHNRGQIADELNISVKTVEAHRANIIKKMKLKNSSDLLQQAIQWSKSRDV